MRNILSNKSGITPVLSSLLLMVVAVAAMSIAITATYFITDNLHDTMGERFIMEDVWFRNGRILIYIRNVAEVPIKITAIYVNRTIQSIVPVVLEKSEHGLSNVTYGWSPDSTYHIKIITSRGTQVADYYNSPSQNET